MKPEKLSQLVADLIYRTPGGRWTGIARDLHAELGLEQDATCPPNRLARVLREAVGHLHAAGIVATFVRTPEARTITLARQGAPAPPPPEAWNDLQQQRAEAESRPTTPPTPARAPGIARLHRAGGKF